MKFDTKGLAVHAVIFVICFIGGTLTVRAYRAEKAEPVKILCPKCGHTEARVLP